MSSIEIVTDLKCYHCGQPCDEIIWLQDKAFCCRGCMTVFEILTDNELCEYYSLDAKPGITLRHGNEESYAYLDEPTVRKKILEFDSPSFARVRFYLPAIHCISCIWLLENLQRIQKGVLKSEVNFAGKIVSIDFNPALVSAGKLAEQLASLGYVPQISAGGERRQKPVSGRTLITKLAVAGFAFGNIMLLSFPEYLGIDDSDKSLRSVFSYLNIVLAVPVMIYSSQEYFMNAWKSFSQKQINIDVPIMVGLLTLFSRSVYDILSQNGPGYLDSLTGLVFFLLIGRWFQSKTYESLAFDRDYKSYFPLVVQKLTNREWVPVIIHDLQIGDQIKIRNLEIVPADSNLLSDSAYIDYSFVTGESKAEKVKLGERVYAGGRLIGQPIELVVTKETSQGHLTSLWNNPVFQKPEEQGYRKTIDRAAKGFTWVVMALALVTAVVWYVYDPSRVWLVLTSVLMVACPCALALAAPFTYGTLLRVFGRNHFYLKNADVIERMASVDTVVFDKTGTVTYTKEPNVQFGGVLNEEETAWVKTLTSFSTHPLSNLITRSIHARPVKLVKAFKEHPGKGVEAIIAGHSIKLGSAAFIGFRQKVNAQASLVFVSIDDELRGYFSVSIAIRKNLREMLVRLGKRCFALVSGDNETDKVQMGNLFNPSVQLIFDQSPNDKLHYIRDLQRQGRKVMMLGDGLNDAGALKQSDVGIAVTDDTGVFTPACDGILQGDKLDSLDKFLALAKSSTSILKAGFTISFMYNAVALTFAVTGHLTPLVAAILMPISSISVVAFSTLAVNYVAARKFGPP